TTYFGAQNTSCTPWHNVDLSYISDYGPTDGAVPVAYVLSPANCSDWTCTYDTGLDITIWMECQ
ncbi:MAG: hypothetical protein ABIH78_01455, partial [Candidatus Peregrinibacteria bacterium]